MAKTKKEAWEEYLDIPVSTADLLKAADRHRNYGSARSGVKYMLLKRPRNWHRARRQVAR